MKKIKFKRHPELVRLGDHWRKPKSRTNKVRRKLKGKKPVPMVGYGSSKKEKYVHPSGILEVLVSNINQIKETDKNICVRISGSVGNRKKIEIVKIAKERGLKVLNPRTFHKNSSKKPVDEGGKK